MNRHQRRVAEAKRLTTADLNVGFQELTDAAHGAFATSIVGQDPVQILAWCRAASSGDNHARMVVQGINDWLVSANKLTHPDDAHQCLLCGHDFINDRPANFAVVMPFARLGPHILVSGICGSCSTKTEDLGAAALEQWRQVWPDLRPIEGGNA